jgi:hypothetical protein
MPANLLSAHALADREDLQATARSAREMPRWVRTTATVLATIAVILVASALSVAIGLS